MGAPRGVMRQEVRQRFRDMLGRVVGADAAIETFVDTLRHAAGARKESVADAGKLGQ